MLISIRRACGVALLFLACSGAAFAQSNARTDDLVLRNGFLRLDYTGTDPGQNGTGLRLQPLGKWSDARGNARYTIWRVRNSNTAAKSIRVDGGGFTLEFSAKARSETLLRSPIVAGNATHQLYSGATLVDTQAALGTAWNDATLIARASGSNHAPEFIGSTPKLAELAPGLRFAPIVDDVDRELVTFTTTHAPSGFDYDAATRAFRLVANSSQVGTHDITLRAVDTRGGQDELCFTLRLVGDFCPIYPLALADAPLTNATPGQQFSNVPRGTGAGNFGLLTWAGSPNAPTLADSLAKPGNSYTYVNPNASLDHQPDAGDWLQGSPGNSNSSAVRNAMDALLGQDIVLPTWNTTRGQGSEFDYRTARFARVRVSAYSFTGNGKLSFAFQGWERCYNDAPTATDSTLQTTRGTSKAFTLVASDPEGDALTYAIIAAPAHGTLSGAAPTFTYTPASGYVGNDRIVFSANDGALSSDVAFVDIIVTVPSNTAPHATPQAIQALEDAPKAIVLSGTDVEGNALTFIVATQPANGTLTGTAPSLVYAPTANFHGSDAFTFKVSDGTLQSVPATVSITVAAINDAPVASAQAVATSRNVPAPINLSAIDVDGDALTFAITTQPAHGTLTGTPPALTYTPAAGYVGTDRIAFSASDGQIDSAPAFVDVTVTKPANTAPQAQSQSVAAFEDAPKAIVLAGVDAEGDALTFTIATQPEHGTLSGTAPNLQFTPASDWYGSDAFTFLVSDGVLGSATALVSITVAPVNDAPVATEQNVQTRRDTAAPITLSGWDVEGTAMAYAITTQPAHGALAGSAPALTYVPAAGFVGTDRIAFTVNDGELTSTPASIDITVTAPVNTAPQPDSRSIATLEDAPAAIVLSGTDAEGDALSFIVTLQPMHGVLSGVAPNLVYLPAADYHGDDGFTFTVSDGSLQSAAATVSITVAPVNDAPTAQAQSLHTDEDTALDLLLAANDVDGDALTYAVSVVPTHGTLSGASPTLRYVPAPNYHGSDTVTFEASDGELHASATIRIDVDGVNDAPTANAIRVATQGQAVDLTLSGSDVDGDALAFEVATSPAHGTLSGTPPHIRYQPAAGFRGSDTFDYLARDAQLASAPASIRVDVSGENRAPVATGGSAQGNEDTPLTLTLGCDDPDGDRLTFEIIEQPANGTLAGPAPGVTYIPAAEFSGDDQLRFRCSDGLLASGTALVSISVAAVNDPPIAVPYQVTVAQGRAIDLGVAAEDAEGDSLTFELVGMPEHGTLVEIDGGYRYTSESGFAGVDGIGYRASDGNSWSAPARVTINVIPIGDNRPPVAEPLVLTVVEDGNVDLPFAGSDPDGDAITIVIDGPTPHGSVAQWGDDEWVYLPEQDFNGTDAFTYRVDDGISLSEPAAVTITITPVDDETSASDMTVETDEDHPVVVPFATISRDGGPLSYTSYVPNPQHGTVSGPSEARVYTPEPDFYGEDQFGYYLLDDHGHESTATITVVVRNINDAPRGIERTIVMAEDEAAPLDLPALDPDGDPVTYVVDESPTQGEILGAGAQRNFKPAVNFHGLQEARLTARDPEELSAPAVFHFVVESRPDAPEIVSVPPTDVDAGATLSYDVNAVDGDGDIVGYRLADAPDGANIDAASGALAWTAPAVGISGVFVVEAFDPSGLVGRQSFTVAIHMDPIAPRIVSQPARAAVENSTYRYDLDAIDGNPGDVLAHTLNAGPTGAAMDGGTGVVQWPAAAELADGLQSANRWCFAPRDSRLDPEIAWHFDGDAALPDHDQVMSIPLVVQTSDDNGDGHIDAADRAEIAVVTYDRNDVAASRPNGVLRLLDGATGAVRATSPATHPVDGYSNPAAADLDGDGDVEFIVPAATIGRAYVFDRFAQPVSSWTGLPSLGWGRTPTIADLDGDGSPEVIIDNQVRHADGSLLWTLSGNYGHAYSAAAGIVSVADLDSDGHQEVIAGGMAYRADGSIAWTNASVGDGFTAVGDLDLDGHPEIAVVNASGLWLLAANGTRIAGPTALPGGGGGPPTLGNFDGDAQLEIGFSGSNRYGVFNHDGGLLWATAVQDVSSFSTGSTLFDFEGDGEVEVLYSDERNFVIFRGRDGALLYQLRNTSGTAYEYPVVADVDGDSSADIVLGANSLLQFIGRDDPPGVSGLRVLRSATRSWMPTRALWNQHAYHIDNIGDDQRIPRQPVASWTTHNTYRLNAFPNGPSNGRADLSPSFVRVAPSTASADTTMEVDIRNRGLVESRATIAHWFGRAGAVRTPIATDELAPLAANAMRTLAQPLPAAAGFDAIEVVVDAPAGADECLSDNNSAIASLFKARVRDPGGLEDSQRWSVSVSSENEPPQIATSSLPGARSNEAYAATIAGSDADRGDALRFDLLTAPSGMRVESATGRVLWMPTSEQLGSHAVRARVIDLAGSTATRDLTVVVERGNRAPVISSTPLVVATAGEPYVYDVDASDPDDDAVHFALDSGPAGMSIDAQTGLVSWTAPPTAGSTHAVALRAIDALGAFATQSFTIVVPTGANHAPTITSVAPTHVTAGSDYAYDVAAIDADGDALAFSLVAPPVGMTIDPVGRVRWTAPAGPQDVDVAIGVVDGRGGSDTQSYTLHVASGNSAPTITSAPANTAKVGREYAYDVIASDSDNDPIVYSLQAAPVGMTLDAAGHLRWTPMAAGVAPVVVRVADAREYVEQSWSITVLASDVALTTDVVASPHNVAPGEAVTLTLAHLGAAGNVTREVRADGEPVALDASGQAVINPTVIGRHLVTGTVADAYESANDSDEFFVSDPSDTDFPEVTLHSPGDNDEVTAPRAVLGTVTDSNLASWLLALRPANTPDAEPTILARGSSNVTNATLTQFDPTLLINGQYALILQGTDTAGRSTSDSVVLRVTGDMKVGQFSITFEDVSIPLAGIPVRVTRTYDSRQRNEQLDFGRGWSVDYQNVRIRESARAGFSWRNYQPIPGPFGQWCTKSNGNRVVTVTLPDGQVESFRAKAVPECTPLAPETSVQLEFEAIDGTDSTLEQTDFGLLQLVTVANSDVYNLVDPELVTTPVDPRHYRLTTPEGVIYQLDQFLGIEKITEPNGNTITYAHDGIRHSSGVGVTFVRDAQDRISEIVLPDGKILTYTYDVKGDLRSFADQLMQTSRYEYNKAAFPHYLTDLIDPRGVKVARNEYDDDGRLVATVDADGHRIEYTHDVDGRIEQIRDRLGRLQTFVYDDNGWVLSETNALGETTGHTYDADGNELTRIDALGHATTWTYDARGNRLTERNPEGELTTSTYDARNNLLTQVDALGHTVIGTTYDPRGAVLTEMRDALGHATHFGYDIGIGSGQSGELTSMSDALNQVTRYELDDHGQGWRVAEVDAMGNRVAYTHDAMGRVRTETRTRTVDADATLAAAPATTGKSGTAPKSGSTETLVTTTTYDDKGRVTRVDNPDGTYSTIEYNAIDKPLRECDRANRCTAHEYNARGEETVTSYADGTSESRTHDANGNVVTQTDRGGRTSTMVYDEAGRLIETILPDDDTNPANNPRTTNGYDRAGRLASSTDANGNVTRYEYDDAGRRTKVILPATATAPAASMLTGYDAAGRRVSSTDALSQTTTYVYDDAGRLTDTVFSDGNRSKVEYDALGRKTADVDPDQRRTEYFYDGLGRLTAVKLAAGTAEETITRYAYDELGNRITQTDAENHTTLFTHDSAGRETSRTLPMGQTESKHYDTLGRLDAHTDFMGRTTHWLYDAVDRVSRIDYPTDTDATFTYTASGQRETATNGTGTQTIGYDAQDRVEFRIDAFGRRIDYTYDSAGNMLTRHSPNQLLVYSYDSRNRMTEATASITGQAPFTTRYEYDQNGNRSVMVTGDSVRTDYDYDSRYRLRTLVKRRTDASLLFAASYGVDATGLRTTIEETDGSGLLRNVAYSYDGLKRLTREAIVHRDADKHRDSRWTYDDVGNRLTQRVTIGSSTAAQLVATDYTYEANDRLLTQRIDGAATTYGYDDNGNTVRRARPGLLTEYEWDSANRLTGMREAGNRATNEYDVDGQRIAQTTLTMSGPVVRTEFLQDGSYAHSQVTEEHIRFSENVSRLRQVTSFGEEALSVATYSAQGLVKSFIHADGLGSTRLVLNDEGAVLDYFEYDAFGNLAERSRESAVEIGYAGQVLDLATGLYYLRSRYLNPELGRFVSQDTYRGSNRSPASIHKYSYVENAPTYRTDPSGRCDCTLTSQAAAYQSGSVVTTGSVGGGAQVAINHAAGKLVERQLLAIVERELPGALLRVGRSIVGQGGRRFYDILIRFNGRQLIIEAKTNLPLGGQALRRLLGQLTTYLTPEAAELLGADVLVVSTESAEAAAIALEGIAAKLEVGGAISFVQGAMDFATFLRNYFFLL